MQSWEAKEMLHFSQHSCDSACNDFYCQQTFKQASLSLGPPALQSKPSGYIPESLPLPAW